MAADGTAASVWSNPQWRKLWTGQAVSLVGDFVFNTTVVLWIAVDIARNEPWAPAAVSGALAVAAAPIFLVSPIAGVYVDRWNRRRIMLACDLIRAAAIALVLIVPLAGTRWPVALQLGLVYVALALISSTSQFFGSARFAILAGVVPAEQRGQAFGLGQATSSIAAVLGPPLAAPLLFDAGVTWALIFDALSYLVSFTAVSLVTVTETGTEHDPGGRPSFIAEFKAGLQFFVTKRVLVMTALTVCLFMFGVSAINVLDVFFMTDNLHVAAGWLGTVSAAFDAGAIAGALIAGRVIRKLGELNVFSYGVILTGVALLIYSRATSLPAAIVVLATAGVPLAIVNVVLGPLVMANTPEEMLGRIDSVVSPVVSLASILSMALAGYLASSVWRHLHVAIAGVGFGRIDTIFGLGAVVAIASGVVAAFLLRPSAMAPPAADPASAVDTGVSESAR
jgi:MFS family permease